MATIEPQPVFFGSTSASSAKYRSLTLGNMISPFDETPHFYVGFTGLDIADISNWETDAASLKLGLETDLNRGGIVTEGQFRHDGLTSVNTDAKIRIDGITPGDSYVASSLAAVALEPATNPVVSLEIDWYESDDTFISTSAVDSSTMADSTKYRFGGSAVTAPALSDYCYMRLSHDGVGDSIDFYHIENIFIPEVNPVPGEYWLITDVFNLRGGTSEVSRIHTDPFGIQTLQRTGAFGVDFNGMQKFEFSFSSSAGASAITTTGGFRVDYGTRIFAQGSSFAYAKVTP